MLVGTSAVFGVATVALVYATIAPRLGRTTAAASAVFLALSDFHVVYSRMGLTDIAFVFFFLLAIWLFAQSEEKQSLPYAVMAGLATGLAWNTKYHGWLAAVVAGLAIAPLIVAGRFGRGLKSIGRLVVAGFVAGLMYVPWFLYVQSQEGGYYRLAANHASYLNPGAAFAHTVRQVGNQLFLDGWMGRLVPAVALAVVVILSADMSGRQRRMVLALGLPVMLLSGIALGLTGTAVVLGVVGLITLAKSRAPHHLMLLAMFALFTLLTPLYTAYARLLMPWLCAVYVLAGIGVNSLVRAGSKAIPERRERNYMTVLAAGASTVFALAILLNGVREPARTFIETLGFRDAAVGVSQMVSKGPPVLVIGEPAVVFYLSELGYPARHIDSPNQLFDLHREGTSVYLVGGIYSRRTGEMDKWQQDYDAATTHLGWVAARVNDVRILNDFPPDEALLYRRGPMREHDLQVFRIAVPNRSDESAGGHGRSVDGPN